MNIKEYLNLINEKDVIYIENSNLKLRIKDYLTPKRLKNFLLKGKSLIYSSLLKHNYENFKLEILEYCKPS